MPRFKVRMIPQLLRNSNVIFVRRDSAHRDLYWLETETNRNISA